MMDPPHGDAGESFHSGTSGSNDVSQRATSFISISAGENISHVVMEYTSRVASAQLKLRPCLGHVSADDLPVAALVPLTTNVSPEVEILKNEKNESPGVTSMI
jgi:hypothetical protein